MTTVKSFISSLANQSDGVHLGVLGIVVLLTYGGGFILPLFGDDVILAAQARAADWSFSDLSRSFDLSVYDFTAGWVPEYLEGYRLYFFRPVFMALLKIDYALWGQWFPGYHILNLTLHWAVAALLYIWLRDFGFNRGERLLAAILFIVYSPNQTAVNWISGRTEILAAFLLLASLLSMVQFYKTRRMAWYAAALAIYIVALGAKENSIMLPFLIALAVLTLYRDPRETGPLRRKLLSIVPFILLIPPYFLIRMWALGGFPVPSEGYYYHSPSHPDFPWFVFTKFGHSVLSLIYQVPAALLPAILEYSVPIVIFMAIAAVATLVFLYRRVPNPHRWFIIGWVLLTLAPTVPIGYNPIYFYMPSLVIPVIYLMLYKRWQLSWRGTALLVVLIGGGYLATAASAFVLTYGTTGSRAIAIHSIEHIRAHPEAEVVYLLDYPARNQYSVPEIRWRAPDIADKDIVILNLSPIFMRPAPSDVVQVAPDTFEIHASEATFGSTGFENMMLRREIIEFPLGFTFGAEGYTATIVATEPAYDSRHVTLPIALLRRHLDLPPREQLGIKTLRFEFEDELDSPRHLFLQIMPDGVRRLDFDRDG